MNEPTRGWKMPCLLWLLTIALAAGITWAKETTDSLPRKTRYADILTRADLVCTGIAKIEDAALPYHDETKGAITGVWRIGTFEPDSVIIGKAEKTAVRIRFFQVSSTVMYRFWITPLPIGKRCLVFLKRDADSGLYTLMEPFAPVLLPEKRPPIRSEDRPMDVLAKELIGAVGYAAEAMTTPASEYLVMFGIRAPDALAALRHLSESTDLDQAILGLTARIRLGDKSALVEACRLTESKPLRDVQVNRISLAIGDSSIEETTEQLAPFLKAKDVAIRRAASYAIREGKAQAKNALPILASALEDPDLGVQYNVIMGMARHAMKGGLLWAPAYDIFLREPKVYVTRWKDWWQENRTNYLKPSQDTVPAPAN